MTKQKTRPTRKEKIADKTKPKPALSKYAKKQVKNLNPEGKE